MNKSELETTPERADSVVGLLPCPFCGSKAVSLGDGWDEDGNWVVVCLDCKSAGTFCAIQGDAIKAWNTRTEAVARENESLRSALQDAAITVHELGNHDGPNGILVFTECPHPTCKRNLALAKPSGE